MNALRETLDEALLAALQKHIGKLFEVAMADASDASIERFQTGMGRAVVVYQRLLAIVANLEEPA